MKKQNIIAIFFEIFFQFFHIINTVEEPIILGSYFSNNSVQTVKSFGLQPLTKLMRSKKENGLR